MCSNNTVLCIQDARPNLEMPHFKALRSDLHPPLSDKGQNSLVRSNHLETLRI